MTITATSDRTLALITVVWVTAVALSPLGEIPAALVVTGSLIVGNLLMYLIAMFRSRRMLVLLPLCQILLFGVLHYQVFRSLGTEHYAFDEPPGFTSWAGFAASHVLRAADILDFLEEYQIRLQNIRHNSQVSAAVLVAMHLIVGSLLLGVLIRGGRRILWKQLRTTNSQKSTLPPSTVNREGIPSKIPATESNRSKLPEEEDLSGCGYLALKVGAYMLLMILMAGMAQYARVESDVDYNRGLWWVLDTGLRAVDIADVIQVYHLQMHAVEVDPNGHLMALLFRLLLLYLVADWLSLVLHWVFGLWIPRTADDLIDDLSHMNSLVADSARRALEALGLIGLPALTTRLQDASESSREQMAEIIGAIGPTAVVAIPVLLSCIDDPDPKVAAASAKAIGMMGEAARPTVQRIIDRLAESDTRLRLNAIEALGALHSFRDESFPHLLNCVQDADALVRAVAVRVLGTFGNREAFPTLVKRLRDKDASVRAEAVTAVGTLGENAFEVVQELIPRCRDKEEVVRSRAVTALARHRSIPDVVTVLVERLDDTSAAVREASAKALYGCKSDEVLKSLIVCLRDDCGEVREAAADSIASFGPDAASAVKPLIRRLRDEDRRAHRSAVVALECIGAAAEIALPHLTELMRRDPRNYVENAIKVIEKAIQEVKS